MNAKSKLVVVSADYPGPDNIYGDVFVHTRLKFYLPYLNVSVIGFNIYLKEDREYEYEQIASFITADIQKFTKKIIESNPDVIAVHLIQHHFMDFLLKLNKPIVVFIHGFEATAWYRRLFNYNSLGALPYLWKYAISNNKQLRKLRKFLKEANTRSDLHFVFVSKWLKKAVEKDVNIKVKNAHVIPNPIDINLFSYAIKHPDLCKKILVLRSFKARNYANDIAIEVILKLSKFDFFKELEITIYGEGYLFKPLTDKIKHLPNVKLMNFFVENRKIHDIHNEHGIFLCPSRMDTQGVSMCEAMSSGLVPISSPIGGIPEYVTDQISGFLQNSVEEMVDKIKTLYENPALFLSMSQQARDSIVSKCSTRLVIPQEVNLINSLIGKEKISIEQNYQQCKRCVLDTEDGNIFFDEEGICNYCRNYEKLEQQVLKTNSEGLRELEVIISEVKKHGEGRKYDSILGLSGGVDSTYLAYQAKKLGLRPLAIHFDNGWNSELAVSNIENIVNKLGLDLHTFVIDWEEFRDLQLAFLKASVVDIEMVTDHAIIATLYKLAIKYDIKYILSGTNIVTEGILPQHWIHRKGDHIHIKEINTIFNKTPLKKFPLFDLKLRILSEVKKIKSISLLNYLPYNKVAVKEEIKRELSWRDYGGKHYESVFTRFYQGYILPRKFGIDKRKAHLSNLICSRQITREDALRDLKSPPYDEEMRRSDYDFVIKKLNLTTEEFEDIMKLPIKKHTDYLVEEMVYDRYPFLKIFGPLWRKFKKIQK